MTKCIVTGGAGFIGSHVVDLLIDQGYEVHVVDNLSTGLRENINPKAIFHNIDIQDEYSIIHLPKVEYVFHLAALARIQPSIQDPIITNLVNVNGTLNLLEYCRSKGAKIIFSSSSSIYEAVDLPTEEEDEKDPKNPYALQKWISEQYIRLYSELYNVDYTILRYFNVYGERQIPNGAYAAVIGIFLEQAKKGLPLTITNDGEQRRDFTYVKDVAVANVLAINWPRNAYNIGAGNNYSVNEIAKAIGGDIVNIGERIGEIKETLADNEKALAQGWMPTTNVIDWIKRQL